MEGGNIKPINRTSVHKICSGQVVLTLATAVKELVENSLDAGATIIEVRLKEYGSELIEVIDNGKGVKESDFQSITLKHHTSKINDFSDVEFVSTFGFRGEALSSLCALSNVEIITCHQDAAVGSLLIYDHDGKLVKCSPTHRQVGTTVILKNLFFTLPVRHKEFLRNIRREYQKMIQLLTAYCLISVNRKITCTNTTDKGRKSIVVSTNSCDNLKDNIISIFGGKQVNNLIEFVQCSPSDSVLEEYFLQKTIVDKCKIFQIEGYISSSSHGEGRSSTDRQFFFINGRPCDLPKVSKLINEIYHSFNKAQYPFVFLNINLTEGSADVNVTPDKRQIFIPEEKLLLCIIKFSLLQMYQIQPSQMKISSPNLFFQKNSQSKEIHEKHHSNTPENVEENSKRKIQSSLSDNEEDSPFSPPSKSLRKSELILASDDIEETVKEKADDIQDSPDSGFESVKEEPVSKPCETKSKDSPSISPKKIKTSPSKQTSVNVALTLPFNEEKAFKGAKNENVSLKDILQKAYRGKGSFVNSNSSSKAGKNSKKVASNSNIGSFLLRHSPKETTVIETDDDFVESTALIIEHGSSDVHNVSSGSAECKAVDEPEEHVLDEPQPRRRKTKNMTFDIETIKKNFKVKKEENVTEGSVYRKFRSKIAPTDNSSAEEELKKEIKKENFADMTIIGQFNLGFIIARLNDDLFIIDQHATDEKYNFEVLQRDTVLETQKLFSPQNLNLTAVSEAVLIDNLHIFEKSGFRFNIDEENSVGNKVQLVSVPVSHNWSFGKEDIDEMIFMLTDNPVSMIRPSRINQMFASRACRKSVMIGTALTVPMMKKQQIPSLLKSVYLFQLVVHMGEIEQPWNCPHGRPTMRHLFNLNLLKSIDNESSE